MRIMFIIAAIVLFAVAAILCFVGSTSVRDVLGIAFIGLAVYAASAVVPAERVI